MKKIFSILLVGLLVIGLTGCGKNKNITEPRDWKDRYFNYLSYMVEHNPIKVHKVGFIKSEVSDIPPGDGWNEMSADALQLPLYNRCIEFHEAFKKLHIII